MRAFKTILVLFLMPCMVFAQKFTDVKNIKPSTRDYSEFAASYFEDGIIFCSNSKTSLLVSHNNMDNQPFYDIYFYSPKGNKHNADFNSLDSMINSVYNDGPVTTNGNVVFFSRNYLSAKINRKVKTNVGIFYSKKNGNSWSDPIPFPFNNEQYNMGQPSVSTDGNTLYFASNMPGGLGEYDIYVSYFENGKWTTPVNLGNTVNTTGSELFPFIHSSGRLYFSTNYFDTEKKFDIYYSDNPDNQWTKPFRLSEPINTTHNDFAFICDNTMENGYFSSDRKGTDDIFQFFSTLPTFETCDTMIERNYCYHFEEAKTVDLDTIPGEYEWVFSDSTKIRSEQTDHCFSGPGLYNVQLNMYDTITGEFVQMIASYDILIEDPVEPYIICPEKIKTGIEIEFDASQTNLPDKKLEQFVWTFSDNKNYVGKKITRTFEKPGTYTVNLGVTFDKEKGGNVQKRCVFKEILVE